MAGKAPNCTSPDACPDTSLFQQVTEMSCRARVSVVQESSLSKCHPFLFALQTSISVSENSHTASVSGILFPVEIIVTT